jgi:hypothetical protein
LEPFNQRFHVVPVFEILIGVGHDSKLPHFWGIALAFVFTPFSDQRQELPLDLLGGTHDLMFARRFELAYLSDRGHRHARTVWVLREFGAQCPSERIPRFEIPF